jgi:hypothetical protein
MFRKMKLLNTILITLFLCSCHSTTKIYLVRHAEKVSNAANADLKSPEGFARANVLKDSLITISINAIFSTVYLVPNIQRNQLL